MTLHVRKRNGKVEPFDFDKIITAVKAAFDEQGIEFDSWKDDIMSSVRDKFGGDDGPETVGVEDVQDAVERILVDAAPYEVAKAYIIYRESHKEMRFIKERIDYMDQYADSSTNASTASETDPNANMQIKNVANLDGEVYKTMNRKIQRYRMRKRLERDFPEVARQYEKDLARHIIYEHDESSTPAVKNYTYSPDEVVNFRYNEVECLGSLKTLYEFAAEPEIEQDGDGVWSKFPENLYVKDRDGSYTKVTRLTRKTRYNDMVRVKTAFGEDLIVTANHPLIVSDDKNDRINAEDALGARQLRLPCTISFKGVRKIDLAACVDCNEVHASYILTPETQAPYFFAKRFVELDRDLGYVVGFFIGDGNYNNTFGDLMFSQKDKETLENIADSLFKSFGVVSYIHQNDNGVYTMKVCSDIVYDFFRNYLKIKDKAWNKCLPYNILEFNEDFAKGVIEGIIDSDGAVVLLGAEDSSVVSIRLSSRECIMQLTELLRYFGYGVSNTHQSVPFGNNTKVRTNYDVWGVYFTNAAGTVKFDKSVKWRMITKEVEKGIKYNSGWSAVTSIEPVKEGVFLNERCKFIYDITTESNTFECNNLWVHNCEAVTLYPLLVDGTKGMDGLGTTAPKNLNSFCGQLVNLTFLLSSQCKGAVAFGEFFNFLDYFCAHDFGDDYHLRGSDVVSVRPKQTIIQTIHQAYQQIVYGWNQPAGNRSYQSPFTNISYYDSNYWHALFDDFLFPDGSRPVWERVDFLQRDFMEWFNKERTKTMLTFPVETMALLSDGNDIIDKDYKVFTNKMYAKGHSFFTYISDNPNSLSSCCRLRNKINENTFSFTNGLTGVQTGSANVMTLNLSRIVQDWSDMTGYHKKDGCRPAEKIDWTVFDKSFTGYLVSILERVYKYQIAYKSLLYDVEKAGMLNASTAGYIKMNKLYSTIGLNGINEAAEFLGLKCSYNDDYKHLCQLITGVISSQNKLHGKKDYMFNTEFVPAEGLSSKNYKWDKADGYWVPDNRNLYNSYFYLADDPETSVLDRFRLHGREFTGLLDGGVGLHCNLADHLSVVQYTKLMDFAIKNGTSYYTFNVINSSCDDCGYISKSKFEVCPKCGSEHVSWWTRVIGFLRPIKSFDSERYKEAERRVYSDKANAVKEEEKSDD